jgi:MSHA biogenesis protein MshO
MDASLQRGFTLVELVTVIILLGILSMGTVQFISDSSTGLASTMSRTKLAGDARSAIDRISLSLRDALPNSVRVAGGCIEFTPIVTATTYITLPVTAAASSFQVAAFDPLPAAGGLRAVVYPSDAVYTLGSPGVISETVSLSAPDVNNEVTVTLAASHQFSSPSPSRRLFLVDTPISYCVDAAQLWRYENYGFLSTQPDTIALPNARPDRALIADNVSNLLPFIVGAPTLTRNAVVQIDMTFERDGDLVRIEDQVQVRNVP